MGMRTSVAIGFGWFCGAMTQVVTDSLAFSFALAFAAGLSFGVAERIWDNYEHD